MQPELQSLTDENARLQKRLERERSIRREAEAIAEKGLRDLYERQRELQTLERIATQANQGDSIRDVLQFSIEEICRFHGWKAGHGYIVHWDEETYSLRPAGIWFAVEPETVAAFRRVTVHSEFEIGTGLPGRAFQSTKPIWISDLSTDTNFPRLGVGLACGLRSAVSFPVLSGDDVVAVLEFFDTSVREPDEALLHMMSQIGNQLGRVIERQKSENVLRLKNTELALERDRAEAADRAKSAFLATMSHELRTPLNAIIGFSELMQNELGGPLNAEYHEYVADILRSGVHLKNIINDILDLSKIAMGGLEVQETTLSIAAILENCYRIVHPLARSGKVELERCAPGDLPMIRADETRLQQIVLNLLSNAVKFTPPGGRVSIHAACQSNGELVVTIADTGIGMSEENIVIALQPFRQIDSSLNRRYEGTGLGLPLAKALSELHGGRLEIESKPDHGTKIRICLPATRVIRAAA